MSENIANIEKGLSHLRRALESGERLDHNAALLISIKALMDCKDTPCWLKGTNGRMLYVNPAYTSVFGITADEYAGYKDGEKWDIDTANRFIDNDKVAADKGSAMLFIEKVTVRGVERNYKITKWPVVVNGVTIGVAGESLGIYFDS